MAAWLRTLGIVTVLFCTNAPDAGSQAFPTHPVRIVVPFPPGGPADAVGRELAQRLSADWSQGVVVDNRAGGGGSLAGELVARSPADGHTVIIGATSTHAVNPTLLPGLPYDAIKDFTPIAMIAITPNVLVVRADSGALTVADLVALARAKPATLAFGSGSPGSAGHLAGELFRVTAGIDIFHVPYKGAAPAMQGLLAGDTAFMFASSASIMGQLTGGKVRALAVTSATRSRLLPDVPTMAEAGLPGFDMSTWFGLLAPAHTPPAVIAKWYADVSRILAAPATRDKLALQGAEVTLQDPAAFAAFLATDVRRYARLIKQSGAKFD